MVSFDKFKFFDAILMSMGNGNGDLSACNDVSSPAEHPILMSMGNGNG